MTLGHTLLVADGDMPAAESLRTLCTAADRIIALDGAATKLLDLNITPHVIIGDLDGLKRDVGDLSTIQQTFKGVVIIEATDQNQTDFEKGLAYCHTQKLSPVLCAGAFGHALDHTLYNVDILARYANKLNLMCLHTFMNEAQWCFMLPKSCTIHIPKNTTVSFIPLSTATITAKRLKWPLNNTVLQPEKAMSVRNTTLDEELAVQTEGNCLFICATKSPPKWVQAPNII